MECIINAHKGVGIELNLAGNKTIAVPAAGTLKTDLTGDQAAHVEAYLESQEKHERLGATQFGGKLVCKEREAPPPKGSKKALMLEEMEKPKKTVTPTLSKAELKG